MPNLHSSPQSYPWLFPPRLTAILAVSQTEVPEVSFGLSFKANPDLNTFSFGILYRLSAASYFVEKERIEAGRITQSSAE
jgi:hypothetical protein